MSILTRNKVRVFGSGSRTLVFAHGYGCDQNVWRMMTPAFEQDFRIVLFDYVGAGGSDLSQYDALRYGSLDDYARDALEVAEALQLRDAVFIGHSVSAVIGALAHLQAPEVYSALVMVSPSPCYLNDGDYQGGFSREDLEGLLEMLARNHLGWSAQMAPVIMGSENGPELSAELEGNFCRTRPDVARDFAEVTFLSDCRHQLPRVKCPTLVLQCARDNVAPRAVGEYVHRAIAGSRFVPLAATGHCPHMSAPHETSAAILQFLLEQAA